MTINIEKELQSLIGYYATFDIEKKTYTPIANPQTLLSVDEYFNKLINRILLADGLAKVDKNYKKLSLYFHPDKSSVYLPEVAWLEEHLSEGKNDGTCFKTLSFCYEKITTPQKFKEIKFNEINNREEFKQWLEILKTNASTYTSRSLYGSLIDLLEQAGGYFDEAGQIKPKGLRALITFLPVIFSSYGAIIFSEQLFAIYALYFILLKGGQYLERKSTSQELQQLGRTLQEISVITATATTTLLVRLLEMTFWVSRQCFDMSLQIGSAILTPLLKSAPAPTSFTDTNPAANLCKDLILASSELRKGSHFKTPELKLIAAPLEYYLGLNAEQYLPLFRSGWSKKIQIESILLTMQILDNGEGSLADKLQETQKVLEKLKKNEKIYDGKTASAIDQAENVIRFLNDDAASLQLVSYNK